MLLCLFFFPCSSFSGPIKGQVPGSSTVSDKKPFVPILPIARNSQIDYGATHNKQLNYTPPNVCVHLVGS